MMISRPQGGNSQCRRQRAKEKCLCLVLSIQTNTTEREQQEKVTCHGPVTWILAAVA